ncbi:MAG TPA: pyruvate kinase, partial [Candidatus Omnitrophota bacterium]|nr:pyruvate kinase [Candidatus Omnitrophota bacterium]
MKIKKREINRRARTRIIATLGPSSETYAVLRKMVSAGLDMARINFSHGTHAEHLGKIRLVREINRKYRRNVKLLQDLEGYRIRISRFRGKGVKALKKHAKVRIVSGEDQKDPLVIPMDYRGDFRKITSGTIVYIDDGNIILKVLRSSAKQLDAVVVEGGILKERKGVNMPGVKIPFSTNFWTSKSTS